jgi:hypothetical protein
VHHYILLVQSLEYLVNARLRADLLVNIFRTLINRVTDNSAQPLLFANFGLALIKLLKGQILGTIIVVEQLLYRTKETDIFLGLINIFEGLPLISKLSKGAKPNNWPYLVEQP